jgi:hypothetical protein
MLDNEKIGSIDLKQLKSESDSLKSGLGVVAWATLEMFKRGGMPAEEIKQIQDQMNRYFAKPSNDVCNAVLRVVETRLVEDKEPTSNIWYA